MSCFRWLAFFVMLVAALFGVHTAGMGYDDDDPNRISLVRDYPRTALNVATHQHAAALDRPLSPDLAPELAIATAPLLPTGLAAEQPIPAWHPRAHPRRGPPAARPRDPPSLA